MTSLKGSYPGAHGHVHALHDDAPKKAFKSDALKYLRAVLHDLGWEAPSRTRPAITWNAGGPGMSGDATLVACPAGTDTGVYVSVNADGHLPACSPSGVALMFRLCSRSQPFGGHDPNQWPNWTESAAALAVRVRTLHTRAGQLAPLASCPIRLDGGTGLQFPAGSRAVHVQDGRTAPLESTLSAVLSATRSGRVVLVHDQRQVTILCPDPTHRRRTQTLLEDQPVRLRARLATLLGPAEPTASGARDLVRA